MGFRKRNNAGFEGMENSSHIRKIMASERVCMFETIQGEPPFHIRPMRIVKVDNDGAAWFFSGRNSRKNHEIAAFPTVQLIFSDINAGEFMVVFGTAEIIIDLQRFRDLWTPDMREWFSRGVRDPELSLIKVTPHSSYYWNALEHKMSTVISALGSSAISNTAPVKESDLIV